MSLQQQEKRQPTSYAVEDDEVWEQMASQPHLPPPLEAFPPEQPPSVTTSVLEAAAEVEWEANSSSSEEVEPMPPPAQANEESFHERMNKINQLLEEASGASDSFSERMDQMRSQLREEVSFSSRNGEDKSAHLGWSSEEDSDDEEACLNSRQSKHSRTSLDLRDVKESRLHARASALQVPDSEKEMRQSTTQQQQERESSRMAVAKAGSMATVYLSCGICFILLGVGCAIAAVLLKDKGREGS